jgi:hypothetical protein
VPQYPPELLPAETGVIGDNDPGGMNRIADPDAAVVMNRDPGRSGTSLWVLKFSDFVRLSAQ